MPVLQRGGARNPPNRKGNRCKFLFGELHWGEKGWRLNHFPGQPVPMLDNPFSEVKFPNIQSKPPLAQLEAISSRPITCYLGEETDPHLATTSCQAKPPQFPQPLLIRLVLQTLHQLRCPSLDTLQHLNVSLVVRGPKLNTGFEPLFPKPVALHGVAVTQVQDPALGLVKPHTIGLGPSIQPVQVPLQSLSPLKQINTPTQLGVLCKLTEGALDPFVQIIDKHMKQNWPQHRALGNTACDRLPTGVNSIHHHPLGPAVQPVLYPAKSTPVQAMSSQFLQENAVLEGCYKVSPEPSLLQAEQPQLSQPVFIGELLQPSDHLHGPSLDSLQQVHVLIMLGAPELDADFRWGLTRAEQSGRITSLDLLATLLMQPRIQLAFWAASAHCQGHRDSYVTTWTGKSKGSTGENYKVLYKTMPLTKRRLLAIGGAQAATSSEVVVAEMVVNWGHGHLLQKTSWWESLLCSRATTDTRVTQEGNGAPTHGPFRRNERQRFPIFGVQVSVRDKIRLKSSTQQEPQEKSRSLQVGNVVKGMGLVGSAGSAIHPTRPGGNVRHGDGVGRSAQGLPGFAKSNQWVQCFLVGVRDTWTHKQLSLFSYLLKISHGWAGGVIASTEWELPWSNELAGLTPGQGARAALEATLAAQPGTGLARACSVQDICVIYMSQEAPNKDLDDPRPSGNNTKKSCYLRSLLCQNLLTDTEKPLHKSEERTKKRRKAFSRKTRIENRQKKSLLQRAHPASTDRQPASACPGSSLLPPREPVGLSARSREVVHQATQLLQRLEGSTWDKTPDHPPELALVSPSRAGGFRLVAIASRKTDLLSHFIAPVHTNGISCLRREVRRSGVACLSQLATLRQKGIEKDREVVKLGTKEEEKQRTDTGLSCFGDLFKGLKLPDRQAAPFYYYLIIFSLIYSCSLSHHFQCLPVSPQSSRASKGEKENTGISYQLFQCHRCHAWVQPPWAWSAQPSRRGRGGLVERAVLPGWDCGEP
ncbi:hypothetical protein QYF61_007282 [Mycteria americana]|uniref:Uncharacterized protein n=1 Tax=Mycteria americana TaxID=33587 RepID=A0AAN7NPW4_MYCAM|nr:hypothetical protein QYF61_007282 [Mycteria americana]